MTLSSLFTITKHPSSLCNFYMAGCRVKKETPSLQGKPLNGEHSDYDYYDKEMS